MARRPITTYEVTDDIDGSPVDPNQPPIKFYDPLTGRALTIDLGPQNAEKFNRALDALAYFVGHAHRAEGPAASKAAAFDRAELTAWAARKGYEVKPRGRVPQAILDEYLASR